ncbi:MAG: transposase [Nitrosomonadales bacterium]|nr:transposase [Nitrosomonadales bacterium]
MGNLAEFEHYLERLCEVLGNVDRRTGLKDYCRRLMLPIAHKSIEPLAACSDQLHVAAKHQSLHHFVAKSAWSDTAVMGRVRDWVAKCPSRLIEPNRPPSVVARCPKPKSIRSRNASGTSRMVAELRHSSAKASTTRPR